MALGDNDSFGGLDAFGGPGPDVGGGFGSGFGGPGATHPGETGDTSRSFGGAGGFGGQGADGGQVNIGPQKGAGPGTKGGQANTVQSLKDPTQTKGQAISTTIDRSQRGTSFAESRGRLNAAAQTIANRNDVGFWEGLFGGNAFVPDDIETLENKGLKRGRNFTRDITSAGNLGGAVNIAATDTFSKRGAVQAGIGTAINALSPVPLVGSLAAGVGRAALEYTDLERLAGRGTTPTPSTRSNVASARRGAFEPGQGGEPFVKRKATQVRARQPSPPRNVVSAAVPTSDDPAELTRNQIRRGRFATRRIF